MFGSPPIPAGSATHFLPTKRLSLLGRWLLAGVRAVAFWTAPPLPLTYLPLVVLVDAGRLAGPGALPSLVAVNLVAVVPGHRHEPRTSRQ